MDKVYNLITDRIIVLLEQGVVPWRKPWRGGDELPSNLVSKKPYRGINPFLLNCAPYGSPWWVSFKQAKKLGGSVKRGEKGFPVVFWKWMEKRVEENGKTVTKAWPMLRYYTVFNVEQCEGLDAKVPAPPEPPATFQPIKAAEAVVKAMPDRPKIRHGKPRAFYSPSQDLVNLPKRELFESPEEYYSTKFHELVHSTGHRKRLARDEVMDFHGFGSEPYSREELVAEIGAAFLCGHAGIETATLENSASYIDGWLHRLKDDKRLVVTAAARAQKAADFILGKTQESQEAAA